jgi:hypothetical protein
MFMTLFRPSASLTTTEAFYALLLAAAWSDKALVDEEQRELDALTGRTPTLAALSPEERMVLHKRVKRLLDASFESTVEMACASLPEAMRVSAFSHAVDIVLADRSVLPQEARFLNQLMLLLQVPEDRARTIKQVLEDKNAH